MSDDDLEIPEFLRRHKDEVLPPWKPPATIYAMSLSPEKFDRLEQIRKETKKAKARGRVAKMLSVKADREALAAGKVWNVKTGRWE